MIGDKDKLKDFVISLLESMPLDLRAEVVITDLIKSGFTLDDFFIRPVGTFKRRFGKDISGIGKLELNDNSEIVNIYVNREGFYDMLPQGLFHNPPGKGTKAFKSTSEMVDEVKLRRREEKEARDFFHIYEIELFNQRLSVEWYERSVLETISITMDDEDFLSYWELPSIFNKKQKGILFYLYPIIDTIRGNTILMEKAYSLIIDENVKIYKQNPDFKMTESFTGFNVLGNQSLGFNLVLGNSLQSYYQLLIMEIGPVSVKNISDYLLGGRNLKIIEELNKFFVPLFLEFQMKLIGEEGKWLLSSSKSGVRLGVNSVL